MILSLTLHKYESDNNVADHVHINTAYISSFVKVELMDTPYGMMTNVIGEGIEITMSCGAKHLVKCSEEDMLEKLNKIL